MTVATLSALCSGYTAKTRRPQGLESRDTALQPLRWGLWIRLERIVLRSIALVPVIWKVISVQGTVLQR